MYIHIYTYRTYPYTFFFIAYFTESIWKPSIHSPYGNKNVAHKGNELARETNLYEPTREIKGGEYSFSSGFIYTYVPTRETLQQNSNAN